MIGYSHHAPKLLALPDTRMSEGAAPDLSLELNRFCRFMAARNYSPLTIEYRQRIVGAFIVWATTRHAITPKDVSPKLLEQYQLHLFEYRRAKDGAPLAFRTQLVRLVAIRAFFRWMARSGVIAHDPAADLELPRGEKRLPDNILTPDEVEAVFAAPNTSKLLGLRDRAILEVLYATGMRRAELCQLRTFDVDYKRLLIMVRKGKGRKDRIVPAGERSIMWLRAYRDNCRPQLSVGAGGPDALFLNLRGKPLKPVKLSERIASWVRASGINKRGSCHLFRHAAATHMLENGADIRFIQEMLGHESLDTTQIYTHVSIAKLAEVHTATHPCARRIDCCHFAHDG